MPYSCRIDAARRLVICVGEGVLTQQDVFAEQPRVQASPDFDPSFDQLIDLSGTAELDFTYASMSDVATTTVFNPGIRRAIVAQTPIQYGIARMFQALSERNNDAVAIFRDVVDAEAWLASGAPQR